MHPGIHTATSSPCSVTRQKKLAFGDAHKSCAPQFATEKSTFRDVATFSDAHNRGASAGACSPDKSVCISAAAFNDPQISRTPLRAHEKQAFRAVAAFGDARKIDAPSCVHSPVKLTLVTWQR